MFAVRSLKTKFALSGASLALLLVAGCLAIILLLRYPQSIGLGSGAATWLAAFVGIGAIGCATWLAFSLGRRLTHALEQLNDSTNRISNGDFTRPVPIVRTDELGDLQRTVDQMRKSLADTTINRNYLDNVLNSMTDAVFVVRPGGMIRFTNQAAQRLTGADAATLNQRHVASLLQSNEANDDERECVPRSLVGLEPLAEPLEREGGEGWSPDPSQQCDGCQKRQNGRKANPYLPFGGLLLAHSEESCNACAGSGRPRGMG